MKELVRVLPWIAAGALVALRLWRRGRRGPVGTRSHGPREGLPIPLGDAGLVAVREVRERIRGRVFRVVTLLLLGVVAAAIVIPVVERNNSGTQPVGVVGPLPSATTALVVATAKSLGTSLRFVPETDLAAAEADLRSGRVGVALVGTRELLVDKAVRSTDASTTAQLVRGLSRTLGVEEAVGSAGLTPAQSALLSEARPLPVASLQPGPTGGTTRATSQIGLILIFIMLTQYLTWTLIGVMEEKSSRVVEVLLATVRPIQLLGGKVLGIGLVALAQATLVVGFALVLAKAVGSDLLKGTAPGELFAALAWLVLGYAFYCWVYAAAGSMAERQDQVQTMALPLSVPIILGYIVALTSAGSGSASTFVKVLAYLPPTAPFAMPALVGLGAVGWWGLTASALISVVCTFGVARVAAAVYRRAVLRTGRRVRLRELVSGPA